MTANLDGVWLKVSRAKKHIDDLEAAIIAFHETKPYLVVTEDDPQTGKRTAKIGGEPAPIPNEVPLILGDAVHAIRASLDYFAFAAAPTHPTLRRWPSPSGASPTSPRPQNCKPL